MIAKSPSGALSPYYYKGGYFHGIHYGSYFDDESALFSMIKKEENFILKSFEKRRILIDLYETNFSDTTLKKIEDHLRNIKPRIAKLAITCEKKKLHKLKKTLKKSLIFQKHEVYFGTDMETAKTWLVSDAF